MNGNEIVIMKKNNRLKNIPIESAFPLTSESNNSLVITTGNGAILISKLIEILKD